MSATLIASAKASLEATFNPNNSGVSNVARVTANQNGANNAIIPDVGIATGTGTVLDANGNVQANTMYVFQGTIAAGATKSVNLNGGSDLDVLGVALALSKVKYFLVGVISPDGIKYVQVGPRGVASGWQGPWGGTGATVYQNTPWRLEHVALAAGIAVSSGDLFLVKNPGGADLIAFIAIIGN